MKYIGFFWGNKLVRKGANGKLRPVTREPREGDVALMQGHPIVLRNGEWVFVHPISPISSRNSSPVRRRNNASPSRSGTSYNTLRTNSYTTSRNNASYNRARNNASPRRRASPSRNSNRTITLNSERTITLNSRGKPATRNTATSKLRRAWR